jgi:hypothetical protein
MCFLRFTHVSQDVPERQPLIFFPKTSSPLNPSEDKKILSWQLAKGKFPTNVQLAKRHFQPMGYAAYAAYLKMLTMCFFLCVLVKFV